MLVVELSPSLVERAAAGMGFDRNRLSLASKVHLRDPQLEHLAWALLAELETDEPSTRLYADSLGLALAAHVLRCYASASARRGTPHERRLEVAMKYIHDQPARELTVAQLASVANLSPSHFKVLFKQSTGFSVHQFVIRSRVQYAFDLLADGGLALADVALQAGFADESHMARHMRRIAGVSPGSVARNAR